MAVLNSRFRWAALVAIIFMIGSDSAIPATMGSASGPTIVMIIRHGEKPEGEKDPNLTPKGYERARALATAIPDHFPKPNYLFAAKDSKGSDRPVETITPLSKALGEPIDSKFKADEYKEIAKAILDGPRFEGKVLLICWHHEKIPELAKALGATDAPDKWDSQVFDRVWEITYSDGKTTFANRPEKALPGDSKE